MENKSRTVNKIDEEFFHSFAIVSGFIDMVGMLGSNVDSLDKSTIQGIGLACYLEVQSIKKLYCEKSDLVQYNGDEPIPQK